MTPLISVSVLDSDPVDFVFDVQWKLTPPSAHLDEPAGWEFYQRGHIPGARFLDLDLYLSDPPSGKGRHPLPDPQRLERLLRDWGVRSDSRIVVYDQGTFMSAPRAWWLLRYLGLTNVSVLDGGLAAWKRAGLPVESVDDDASSHGQSPRHSPSELQLKPGSMPVVDANQAADIAGTGVLIDVRAPERYRGEVEPLDAVAGHIPGAVNLPLTGNLADDGQLLATDQLRGRILDAVKLQPSEDESADDVEQIPHIAAYCGSGVTAALQVLVGELAGVPIALYPGSWSEWIVDPARPIETGEGPNSGRTP